MTPLVGFWTRLEVRRRWRALVVLALLVALSTGVVLASVAGARRTQTSLDRLRADTLPSTLAVLPNQPGFDWEPVRELPGVAALSEFPVSVYAIDGTPPDYESAGFPMDRVMMTGLERPVVLAGRLPDPGRADEAVVSARFVDSFGLGVGDTTTVRLYTPEQIDESFGSPKLAGEPAGPAIPTTIVGVVRSLWLSEDPGSPGLFQPSPGLLEQYRDNLVGSGTTIPVNALVRLSDESPQAVEAFRDGLAAVSGRTDIEMLDMVERSAKYRETLGFEALSLLAFAVAALAAALVLVGQAVARYVGAAVADLQALRAVGMDRRTALAAATAPAVLAGVAGVLVGVAGAVAASPIFPMGEAATVEPAPGVSIDPLVLGAGAAVLVALLVAGAVGAGPGALSGGRDPRARRSTVAALAARLGVAVPLLVGLRFAFEPGRGRSALPVRPALVGAVTGVLGVLAAFTFSAGVTEAADNPDRFGQTYRVDTFVGFDGQDFVPDLPAMIATTAADPDVSAVADTPVGVIDAGTGPVTVFAHDTRGPTPLGTVVLSGRMPAAPNEILLGPATAQELHVGIGEQVPAAGNKDHTELTVTGIGFVPYAGHNNYDDGGWLTPEGYSALIDGFKFHVVLVGLHPGADPGAVVARLTAGGTQFEVTPPLAEVALLRDVEVLPVVLGGFLALLAVGAVGHALATAVRKRRHDVAVLRALGMTRWQTRSVVITQATALAVVGLVFGLPLGVAIGRLLWRAVADFTPVQYEPPVALLALLLAVPVAVLVANALATWPGLRAARLRIAAVLRAE